MPRSFTHTLAAGAEVTISGRWKHLFVESVISAAAEVTIKGEAEGEEFDVKAFTQIRSDTEIDRFILRNPLGAAAVIKVSVGLNSYQVAAISPDTVTINDSTPVDVNVTNTLTFTPAPNANANFNADVSVATVSDSSAISPPANAKGAIVSLITAGVTFGQVRLIGSAASYSAGVGVPLPVSGAPIYLDAAVGFKIANATAGSVDVNVSWIIE